MKAKSADVVRSCRYCGRPTRCPKRQPYVPSDPHVARWPHAPRQVEVLPLCALVMRTMMRP